MEFYFLFVTPSSPSSFFPSLLFFPFFPSYIFLAVLITLTPLNRAVELPCDTALDCMG